jgi:proteic killer suppression protein
MAVQAIYSETPILIFLEEKPLLQVNNPHPFAFDPKRFLFTHLHYFVPSLDKCHVTIYIQIMIKTFADRHTKELYETGRSKRLPPVVWRRALRKLEYLDLATALTDLKVPPSNRFHELERDRKGQFSISINDQWRICFQFVEGDAYDVEITDYH